MITLWNTVYIENAINRLKRKELHFDDKLLSYISPLSWKQMNLTEDNSWRNNKKLAEEKYRPLQPADISQYKKNLNVQKFRFPN